MPHRVLISTADFTKSFPFPYICATTNKDYLRANRPTVKRLMMALIEATHFFKTRKEESKKIVAKYYRNDNDAYLESAYNINVKLFERVPLVTREGMEVQLKDAQVKKPSSTLKVDDVIDDSIVKELQKEGFIDKVFK